MAAGTASYGVETLMSVLGAVVTGDREVVLGRLMCTPLTDAPRPSLRGLE